MWCWRRMDISLTDHVKNEKYYLESGCRELSSIEKVNGRPTGFVTFCVETAFYDRVLKER
jgi:hypothetical protein